MSTESAAAYRRWMRLSLGLGAGGLVAVLIGGAVDLKTTLQLYLGAFTGWAAVPIGSLAILMMMQLIKGVWCGELGAPIDAATRTLPVVALMIAPILIGMASIYPWTHDNWTANTSFRAFYLSKPFFAARAITYFTIWISLSARLPRNGFSSISTAAGGLILYAMTATLAAVDWDMSIEPGFNSSIYGLIFISRNFLAATAFAVFINTFIAKPSIRPSSSGALLISTILLWAYMHAMQYLVIWSGDLPRDISWYTPRIAHGWGTVAEALFLFQAFIPFLLLLIARWRKSPAILGMTAFAMLASSLLEGFWLTMPPFPQGTMGTAAAFVVGIAATLAIGGFWSAAFFFQFSRVRHG
jgi:hypothetical protein